MFGKVIGAIAGNRAAKHVQGGALRDELTALQRGDRPDRHGWVQACS